MFSMPMTKLVAPLATTMVSLAWPTAAGMVLLAALIGMVHYEQKLNEAICRAKIQEAVLEATQAELSEVKDDLHTSQTKPASTDLCLVGTESILANTKIALKQSEKKVVAHVEFRDALGKELSQARRQRDRAEGVTMYLDHALKEAIRKNDSKEDECFDIQCQVQFKPKELQSMTLSLDNTKKELDRANQFSQKAQDEIDEQHATIMSNEDSAKRLSTQLENLQRACKALKSEILSLHLGWMSRCDESWRTKKALQEENRLLRNENKSWTKNNAGTIHAMQSRVDELEGENEDLARDLKVMVERVEGYTKQIEALDREAEKREWNVIQTEIAEVASEMRKSIADEEEEQYEEYEEYEEYESEGYHLWTLDGDSEDDATVYELNEDSEEEVPEWFIHTPTDTKGLPYKQMREDALKMREMTNTETEELKEWDEDNEVMANCQGEIGNLEEPEGVEEQHTDDDTLSQSDYESLESWDTDDDSSDWSGSVIHDNTMQNSVVDIILNEEDKDWDWGVVHTRGCESGTADCHW